jgi:hypothetical protein
MPHHSMNAPLLQWITAKCEGIGDEYLAVHGDLEHAKLVGNVDVGIGGRQVDRVMVSLNIRPPLSNVQELCDEASHATD